MITSETGNERKMHNFVKSGIMDFYHPMPLALIHEIFDHPIWFYEISDRYANCNVL